MPDVQTIPDNIIDSQLDPALFIKQLYISPPPFLNALSPELLDSLQPFVDYFRDTEGVTLSRTPSKNLPYLHSIIDSDDKNIHNLTLLDNLVTDNTYKSHLNSLLYYPRFIENKIHSASGLLFSYVYDSPDQEQIWTNAVSSLVDHGNPDLSTFSYNIIADGSSSFSYKVIPCCPTILTCFIIIYSLFTLYLSVSWENIKFVRSKLGLFIAFVVQTCLSLSASLTIISFIFPSFSVDSLRNFLIIPYFVAIIGIENILRLINSVAATPPENHPSVRLSASIDCLYTTVYTVGVFCGILLLPCIFLISSQLTHLCLFTVLCLVIDLAMHATYFIAILSVDLRRLELEDIITSGSAPLLDSTVTSSILPKSVNIYYHYLKKIFFHPKISASVFTLSISIFFLCAWSLLTNPAEKHNYSAGRIPFFLSSLSLTLPSLSRHETIKIFEPLVLEGQMTPFNTFPVSFQVGHCIQGSFYKFLRLLNVTIVLEFIASIAFILSLTGVILKFLLPPVSAITETHDVTESMQFSSKELTGYHTLDVLQVVSQGSTITTVSLDHKVFVWNAASAPGTRIAKPTQVPCSPEFWPITRVVLSSSNCMVAIFSARISAIKCYNYKTGTLVYHLQDKSLFSTRPLETFFSGNELVVVSKTGSILSISDTGIITPFKIEFSSPTGVLAHARRLLTPRIPERVVCLSSENDFSIGTHIGKVWKFRKLQIQESPTQINMHAQGVHDFSKYKPRPIPAPQAMLARGPMRPGRFQPPPLERPKILNNKIVAIVPVPAINMMLIATSVHGCLFDAQTGIIVKHFQLGHFKPQTLRVFHSHPSHCRFCGCVSVDTLSIAYSDSEDDGMVICHTLTIDNRAKNSICIRVERDPRETRCLGFEATTERQHWIDKVEGWDTTDMNMIMGVRLRDNTTDIETKSYNPSSFSVDSPISSSISWLKNVNNNLVSRNRKRTTPSTHSSSLTSLSYSSKKITAPQSKFPLISNTWEGWAMSATGQITYYDIPDYSEHLNHPNDIPLQEGTRLGLKHNNNQHMSIGMELDGVSRSRLLIRSIGPVTKYGTKSIAVAFGNVIKVLYFGKEESLAPGEPETPSMPYPPSPSLSVVSGSRKWKREVGYWAQEQKKIK